MRTAVHDDVITIGTVAPNSAPQGVGTLWFDTSTTPGSLKVCTSTSPWTWQLANAAASGTSIPAGVIVMWGGLVANIPSGWVLCDGLNGTPDLRSKFIKGSAAGANPGVTGGAASASYTPAGTVGAHTHTFTASSNAASPKLMTANTSSGVAASGTSGSTAPSFSGTPATIPTEPAYYSLCFIQKQ